MLNKPETNMLTIYLIPILLAIFLAINMGASGTSPSFSAVYGADLLKKENIPGLFGIFVFLGVIIAGEKVIATIQKGILPGTSMNLTITIIILLSVSLSLFMANMLKVPQSTSQSTVFALIGPAIYFDNLETDKLFFQIIPTWFITPVLAFILAVILGKIFYKIFRERYSEFISSMSSSLTLKLLVIGGACYVAFAIGSNNVANAVGPVVAMVSNILSLSAEDPSYLMIVTIAACMIAPFFGIGSSIMGTRVIGTTGKEIVNFGPLGATLISIITATLLLLASVTKGIPTSLVQMNTGAILGLSVVKKGWNQTGSNTPLKKILTVWLVAPILSLFISVTLTIAADYYGLL